MEVAIILIFKRTALLCISGFPIQLALSQADSEYRNANIASIIEDHLMASNQDYSIRQSIDFLINANIGLSSLASTKIKTIADACFRAI